MGAPRALKDYTTVSLQRLIEKYGSCGHAAPVIYVHPGTLKNELRRRGIKPAELRLRLKNLKIMPTHKTKVCNHCGKTKDLSNFTINNKSVGGRSPKCKDCRRIIEAARYRRNPQPYKDAAKRWKDKQNAK